MSRTRMWYAMRNVEYTTEWQRKQQSASSALNDDNNNNPKKTHERNAPAKPCWCSLTSVSASVVHVFIRCVLYLICFQTLQMLGTWLNGKERIALRRIIYATTRMLLDSILFHFISLHTTMLLFFLLIN